MKFKIEKFPKVLKNDRLQMIEIIYRDHVEFYKLQDKLDWYENNKKVSDEYQEISMALNNGYHMVNMEDKKTVIIKVNKQQN